MPIAARTSRTLVVVALLSLSPRAGLSGQQTESSAGSLRVVEIGILELQDRLASGEITSVALVDAYLARIAAYDEKGPSLNAVLRLDPAARGTAAERDRERAEGHVRGPLHGIPVVIKDNIDVQGLPTTAGTLSMAGLLPPDDAFQMRLLREAGAVILGKTNLHELGAGGTTISALGGQTRNPYDPARIAGGSSGGTAAAVAASFAPVGWGTDGGGSIRTPAALNNLFGLRPTKGLSSIDGVVVVTPTQLTVGPLARTVTDLAIALDATVGYDAADPATHALGDVSLPSFRESLDREALGGVRIGSLEPWLAGGEVSGVIRRALAEMADWGAVIVPVDFPALDSLLERTSMPAYEFKFSFADYLAATPGAPIESLGEILELGLYDEALDGVLRRWDLVEDRNSPEYQERLRRRGVLRESVIRLMDLQDLDALAYPTTREEAPLIGARGGGSNSSLSSNSGLPALTMPAGFTTKEMPVGLELLARPFHDHRLVALAFAYEQGNSYRRAPLRTPPLRGNRSPEPVSFAAVSEGDTGGGDEPGVVGTFSLDLPAGVLRYRVVASGVKPADVHAIVLKREGGTRPRAVVKQLSGPGRATVEGFVELPAHLLRGLVEGNLELGLYTRGHPLGAARARLVPPLTVP